MELPSFKELSKENISAVSRISSYAENMHLNPYFYKYYWWVFWKGSPCDGGEFLEDKYRMSTAEAKRLMEKLKIENESFWLYNSHAPRRDPQNAPIDETHPVWKDANWAPAFKDDTDRSWNGFR